jgi:hypothetical protein
MNRKTNGDDSCIAKIGMTVDPMFFEDTNGTCLSWIEITT